MCSGGQVTKGPQVNSPFVIAVLWTEVRSSLEFPGIGFDEEKESELVPVLKTTARCWTDRDTVLMMAGVRRTKG